VYTRFGSKQDYTLYLKAEHETVIQ